MIFINKKYFFINNLKHSLLNNNYLFFFNSRVSDLNNNYLNLRNLQAKDLKKLSLNTNNFLIKNSKLLVLNNLENIKLDTKNINYVSYLGYITNNLYNNRLLSYYSFYSKNFRLFIFMIFIKINNLKFLLFTIIYKIIYMINIKIKK